MPEEEQPLASQLLCVQRNEEWYNRQDNGHMPQEQAAKRQSSNARWSQHMKTDRIQNLVLLLVLVVIVAALLGFSQGTISWIEELFVKYLIVPAIASLATGSLVGAATGDTLKNVLLVVRFKRFTFSITAFAAAVAILNLLIF